MDPLEVGAYIAVFSTFAINVYDFWKRRRRGDPITFSEMLIAWEFTKGDSADKILELIKYELKKSENKNFEYTLRLEDKLKKIIKEHGESKKKDI